jgi:uncharacterized protein (DUF302 family)
MSGLESRTEYEVAVRHVRTTVARPFEQVKAALEQAVPPLNDGFLAHLRNGQVEQAAADLNSLAPLSIFGSRDHGGLLAIAGQQRRAIQYDIGNPLTASRMTRHHLGAALYVPLRILLYENEAGQAVFEYDRPISTFGQFGSDEINKTAEMLDDLLGQHVTAAAEAARP